MGGATVVAAGLEGDVGRGAFGGDASGAGLFEGDDFGVVAVVVEVCSFADDLAAPPSGVTRTRTQPTWGFGEARPMVSAASLRARRMKTSSWLCCVFSGMLRG